MYELHTYAGEDGFRWGVLSENHNKVAHGGQGYANFEDMENVLLKMYVPARGKLSGVHVPWVLCADHNSKNGRCYIHRLLDATMLAQSLQEAVGGQLAPDQPPQETKQQ